MTEFNLDRVAGELNSRGIAAEVDQTGGGTATLFAGERFFDNDGEPRWMIMAGPGYFDEHGVAFTDTTEFAVSKDDGGTDTDVVDLGDLADQHPKTIEDMATIVIAFRIRTFAWPDGAYQRADGHWGEHDVLADERARQRAAHRLELTR